MSENHDTSKSRKLKAELDVHCVVLKNTLPKLSGICTYHFDIIMAQILIVLSKISWVVYFCRSVVLITLTSSSETILPSPIKTGMASIRGNIHS